MVAVNDQFIPKLMQRQAVSYIHSIIYATCKHNVWNKEVPANLLYFMEKLEGLCHAMYILHHNTATRASAMTEPPGQGTLDITMKECLDCNCCKSNLWDNLPRNITDVQYLNPYKAIDKFCKHMHEVKWQRFLKDMVYYALSNEAITLSHPVQKVLQAQKRLLQLIEACYLIEVRTNAGV